LPGLWRERRVNALAISLGLATSTEESAICVLRRKDEDGWALDGQDEDNTLAVGRVGCLRGPFRLQVFALTSGNLVLASPSLILAGEGFRPTADLAAALTKPLDSGPSSMSFDVLAANVVDGEEPLTSTPIGDAIGEVVVQISPAVSAKVMPLRYVPQNLRQEDGEDAEQNGNGSGIVKLATIGPDAIVDSCEP